MNQLENRKKISVAEAVNTIDINIVTFLATLPLDLRASLDKSIFNINSLNAFLQDKIISANFVGKYIAYYPTPIQTKNKKKVEETVELFYNKAVIQIHENGAITLKTNKIYKGFLQRQTKEKNIFDTRVWHKSDESITISFYLEDKSSSEKNRNFISAIGVGIDTNSNIVSIPVLLIREQSEKNINEADIIVIIEDHFRKSIINYQVRSRRNLPEMEYIKYIKVRKDTISHKKSLPKNKF